MENEPNQTTPPLESAAPAVSTMPHGELPQMDWPPKEHHSPLRVVLLVIVAALLVGGGFYFWQNRHLLGVGTSGQPLPETTPAPSTSGANTVNPFESTGTNPLGEVETNPYAGIKTNPFE
jgi:hypothetical protein